MEVHKVFHVIEGEGATSYVTNSVFQKTMLMKTIPILQEKAAQHYCETVPSCFTIADMGCSSGPNSLLVMSEIINSVETTRQKLGHPSLEFQVLLNDLPGNDFNTIFKSFPRFHEKLKKGVENQFVPCFVAGVPGTFYGRLFPSRTLDFVHSSNSHHWLSQVPQGMKNNRGNVHVSMTSPPNVFNAYAKQFNKDFSSFLRSRSNEMVIGGQIFITMAGRRSLEAWTNECCDFWELLAKAFRDMVSEGLIDEARLDSFDLPYYTPNVEEVKTIIRTEGSFDLNRLETLDVDWNSNDDTVVYDKLKNGLYIATNVRAVIESMVASHFGESVIDKLFCRYAEYIGEHLAKEIPKHYMLVICMTKNDRVVKV